MIVLDCPQCSKTLRIPQEYAGQAGRCKGCGGTINVPSPIQEAEEEWLEMPTNPLAAAASSVPFISSSLVDEIAEPSTYTYPVVTHEPDEEAGKRFWLGLSGAIALCIGVFAPLVSIPIAGTQNYFGNGQGDGVIVLVLAVVSFFIVFAKKYKALVITGLGSLAMILFTFARIQGAIGEMKSNLRSDLANNPFAGMAEAMMGSVQIQWGWAVLLVGSALLIASAVSREEA